MKKKSGFEKLTYKGENIVDEASPITQGTIIEQPTLASVRREFYKQFGWDIREIKKKSTISIWNNLDYRLEVFISSVLREALEGVVPEKDLGQYPTDYQTGGKDGNNQAVDIIREKIRSYLGEK